MKLKNETSSVRSDIGWQCRRRREESQAEASAIHNRQSEIKMRLVTSSPTKRVVAVRKDDAAPPGLDFILVGGSTNMSRRWRWGGRRNKMALTGNEKVK